MTPSISVVIPTWNRASTLSLAIHSTLAQTVAVKEILICDDGSTDDTEAVVRSIAAGDPRVRWLPGPRGGRPAIPRNRGIRAAQGDWVAFLDSDDAWEPSKLAIQVALAGRLDCAAACSNALRHEPRSGKSTRLLAWTRERLTLKDLLQENWVVCSSCIVRTEVLREAGSFPEAPDFKAVEDYALWLRIATLTDFAYSVQPLVKYTDDPATSVRGSQVLPPAAQRARVVSDWERWTRSVRLSTAARLKVRTALFINRVQRAKAGVMRNLRMIKETITG